MLRRIWASSTGTDPVARAHKKGVTAEHTYRKIFRGYSAQLSQAQVDSLRLSR
jgi:hypothetical protein